MAARPADDAQGLREPTTAPGRRTGPGPRLLRSPSGDARESGGICCGTAVSGTIRASVSCDRHAGPGRLRAVRPPGVSAGAGGRWIRSVKLAFRRGVMTAVTGAVWAGRRSTPLSLWHRMARLRAWLSDGGGHGGAGWAAGPGGPGCGLRK